MPTRRAGLDSMEEMVFHNFSALSKMHSAMVEAFEFFENTGNDEKYRELLECWRNYLKDEPKYGETPVIHEKLEQYEEQLHQSYSPIECFREDIVSIRKDVTDYIKYFSNASLIQQKVTLLLSRLLYNCLLLERCFFPLYDTVYQDHISNIKNQLNICIILGQLDYFSEYFRYVLCQFNEEFKSLQKVSAHVLHVVGVLNFKCHNYKEAIEIFVRATSCFETENTSEIYRNDEYFQTKLLLAYCYEYDHQFDNAIEELIGVSVDNLLHEFGGFDMFTLFDSVDIGRVKKWSERFITVNIPRIIEKFGSGRKTNNLFVIAGQRDSIYNREVGDKHEVLHNLAHCLNELGIKIKLDDNSNRKDDIVSLLYLSRALMLYVAEYNEDCRDFQTCLYMLFGEAKDYDVCLRRINQMIEEADKCRIHNINYEMENMFYLFLIANQSGKIVEDKQLAKRADEAYQRFTDFAKHRYDYDALIHIEIFRFRFEIINILRASIDDEEIQKKLIALRDTSFGKCVFSIRPSAKANRWIVQEYRKTIALYEFLVKYFEDLDEQNINELYNYACHFHFYRKLFEMGRDDISGENMETAIDRIIGAIVDDFISPQSIFILAPITSAIPYQNQTKSFHSLEKELFPTYIKRFPPHSKMERFAKLISSKYLDRNYIDWFWTHEEYGCSFAASKMNPDVNGERYYYCDEGGQIFDRPIHNVGTVNKLIKKINLHRKRHNICRNGQTTCCISIFYDSENASYIRDICKELMIPIKKYQNKQFIFYCKKDIFQSVHSTNWCIVGIDHKLCRVQEQEVIALLCKHDLEREFKLAISQEDYCYICYDIMDSMVAKSDMYWLQEHGIRFWYDREMKCHKDTFSHPEYMNQANALLIFISNGSFGDNPVQSRLYKEIQYASQQDIENRILITIDFEKPFDLMKYLKEELKEDSDKLFRYLMESPMISGTKKSEADATSYLEQSDILKILKGYGVGRDDL